MGFKPLGLGLLTGDSPKEALENALGETSIVGKLYMDHKDKKAEQAARLAEEAKAIEDAKFARAARAAEEAPASEQPTQMKKGGVVKASSASRRADGIASRGKTRGKMC